MNTESWNGTIGTPHSASIASRLATRKDAGIATLEGNESNGNRPCGWPFCAPTSRACRDAVPVNEVQHTPGLDRFEAFHERFHSSRCEEAGCSAEPRTWTENSSTWANFDASENAAYVSAPCSETGILVTSGSPIPSGYVDEGSASSDGTGKENSLEREVKREKDHRLPDDGPLADDIKSAGAEPACVASRNFAARLLPIGNTR